MQGTEHIFYKSHIFNRLFNVYVKSNNCGSYEVIKCFSYIWNNADKSKWLKDILYLGNIVCLFVLNF